jgi:hypothetical protein
MALTFINYHLRSTDGTAVTRIAEEIIHTRAFISPASGGWVTVCDESSQSLDPVEIDRLAMEFSRRLETALFTFLIPDIQVFAYHVFDTGDLIDEYNSTPELYGPISNEARFRLAGHPSIVLKHCRPGTLLSDVQSVLVRAQAGIAGGFASSASAHDRALRLATLLGIEHDHSIFSFEDLEANIAPHAEQYAKIESRTFQRPLRRTIPRRLPPKGR